MGAVPEDAPDVTSDAPLQLMREIGVDEREARFIMAISRGERDGDVIPLPDPSELDGTPHPLSDAYLVQLRSFGVSEQEARFIPAIECGEITGDTVEVPLPEPPPRKRGSESNQRRRRNYK